ncbi:MAG: hypothetical protein CML69_15600 [Rhodobacteraceae bacterium]|nr:hypothetical protein [Paracoccaceae bacterium]
MSALYWLAYAAWALAAVSVLIGLTDGGFEFFVIAISIAISGVLFFAFGKVISLLSDIRGAVVKADDHQHGFSASTERAPDKPTRSIEEISSDLDRLKGTQS